MGPLVVVFVSEMVEGGLLGPQRGHWRELLLESEMHPLVASVLLRLAGLDALVADAELEPPGGQLGEAAESARGQGNAVV